MSFSQGELRRIEHSLSDRHWHGERDEYEALIRKINRQIMAQSPAEELAEKWGLSLKTPELWKIKNKDYDGEATALEFCRLVAVCLCPERGYVVGGHCFNTPASHPLQSAILALGVETRTLSPWGPEDPLRATQRQHVRVAALEALCRELGP